MATQSELARRLCELLAAGAADPERFAGESARVLHPRVEYREDPRWPGAQAYVGPEAVEACFRGYLDVLGTVTIELLDVEELGGWALASLAFRVFSGGDRSVDQVWFYLLRFEDELAREWRAFLDRDEAVRSLQAAG